MAKRKKKLRKKRFILFLIMFILFVFSIYSFFTLKIQNIFISNNNILSNQKITELAGIDNESLFFLITKGKMKRKILTNPYIKEVEVSKTLFGKICFDITEYKPLFYKYNEDELVIETGIVLSVDNRTISAPILINYIDEEYASDFIIELGKLDQKIINRISEIEYSPTEVDKGRFLLYMNDQNLVYINILRLNRLNKYDEILPTFEGNRGILYLDSGNYFEILP